VVYGGCDLRLRWSELRTRNYRGWPASRLRREAGHVPGALSWSPRGGIGAFMGHALGIRPRHTPPQPPPPPPPPRQSQRGNRRLISIAPPKPPPVLPMLRSSGSPIKAWVHCLTFPFCCWPLVLSRSCASRPAVHFRVRMLLVCDAGCVSSSVGRMVDRMARRGGRVRGGGWKMGSCA